MENKSETGNGSAENEESDSGDSLFITQKPVPHPVRSTSAPHLSHRSTPLSPRFHELASSGESEPEHVPKKHKKRPGLPNYNFPFLKQRKPPEDRSLYIAQNRAIHYMGMAGFFKCVSEMWPSGNRRTSFESSLPSVESDNEEITPISEEEKSDEEDVKVIDKRQFVYSVKPIITKSSQPWFKSKINMSQRKQAHEETLHFGRKNTSQSASNKPKVLSNKQPQHQDSGDSDATLIEDSELFTSRSKNANIVRKSTRIAESSVNSTDLQPNANQGNELPASEESDNTQSQSILQYIRRSSQDSGYNENGPKKKRKHKMDGDNNDYLSQNSLLLSDNLKTNSHKNKTLRKNDGEEIIHDVEFDLETSPVAEPVFVSSKTEKEVNGQSIHEDAGQPSFSHDDASVQKKKQKKRNKKTVDLENTENATSSLSLDPSQMLGQSDINAVEEKEASDMSDHKRRKRQKKPKADPGDRNEERDVTLEKLQLNNTDTDILSALVESGGKSDLVDNSTSDCIATQSDESVSVRKKKRNLSSATETEENSNLPLLQPTQSYGADKVDISIKDNESTDIHRHKNKTSGKSKTKMKERKEKQHEDECDLETAQLTEPVSVSSSADKGVNDQCIYEDSGQPSCPNVEDLINDVTVHKKKKKKHKKKSADLDDAENGTNGATLVPSQMPDIGQMENISSVDNVVSDTSDVKRKKHKKKQKADPGECNDEQDVTLKDKRLKRTDKNYSLELVESQEKPEFVNRDNSASDFIATQSDDSVSVRKKKRNLSSATETEENANLPLLQPTQSYGANKVGISIKDNESTDIHRHKSKTFGKSKTKTKERKEKQHEDECDLETAQLTEPVSVSSSADKGVNDQCIYEDSGQPSCPNVEDLINDVTVQKKKKKKHKKKSADLDDAENGTNGATLVPSQMPDIGQTENISSVDNVVSDTSDVKRKKHKKKRKADPGECNDEQDVTLKDKRLKRTNKNDSLELVESQEKPEFVNRDNSASDFIVTQSDDSVSVRKKKRKVSSAAGTVENANVPLSQSAQSHGADELGISANDVESAKLNGLLQETDLGSKRKKKKKRRMEDDELDNLGSNGEASETTEMSRCNESKDCDSTVVTQPHSGDGDQVEKKKKKKKKKKKSKHESDQPDFEITTQHQASDGEESSILSPSASKKKKKKKHRDNDEGRAVETELEETTMKREKIKKNRIKDVDQITSSPSHGEMSTSSGRLQTSSRAKGKKRLYNPGSENFLEEF